MAIIKNLVWIEKVEGKEKPNYHQVGIYRQSDDGKASIKINTIPLPASGWNGWLSIFDKKENEETI